MFEILDPIVVDHFDNHPLATRPVYMDDNARPHLAQSVTQFMQKNAITTLHWPAMSPDLNPIEHVRNILGRRIQKLDPPVATLQELAQALHQEWQKLHQDRIKRLTGSMRRRVYTVIRVHGGYTRY